MIPPDGFILLARIGAAHGVRGEVRVKTFTEDASGLGKYGPLSGDDSRTYHVERLRPAKDVLVVKFRGVDDRDAAEALNGVSLSVERDRLPVAAEEEFYHSDLIGLDAESEGGEKLGTVVAIHNFGAGDIIDIAPQRGPSLLVPFTRLAVPLVDVAGGRIVVAPPAEIDEEASANEGENE